jgi:hypothetical protein
MPAPQELQFSCGVGILPTPQELQFSCGVGILRAPSSYNYYHFIYTYLVLLYDPSRYYEQLEVSHFCFI